MKFSFKIQQYQTDAVNAVVDVFKGQVRPAQDNSYLFDPGIIKPAKSADKQDYNLFQKQLEEQEAKQDILLGYANAPIQLDKNQLLQNIKLVQNNNNIKQSAELAAGQGKCSLDIEMETGTGKTYVYIKTMFELNKQYGWNKFIIIVPSVAIREGVKKSFEVMEEHFMSQYGKKARYFTYDSNNLTKIDDFAKSNEINVMIINNQAFAKSLNEDKNKEGRGGDKGALIIYSKRDEFGSRRPIDVIAQTNPILILDEPQKLAGNVTQKAMKNFNPLFSVNYSATHKEQHNMVYVLDALDAYNQKLVKKIEVKGLEVKNLKGIDSYLYCEEIETSPKKPPRVRMEFEVQQTNGVKRTRKLLSEQDSLYELSNGMKQYEGYIISEIDPRGKGTVTFLNGEVLHCSDVVGDVTELYKRRLQIRETLLSHLEKEQELYAQGIKTLSLFFIDKVENYRKYNEDGTQELGEYGKIFEEEYKRIFDNKLTELFKDDPYVQYLNRIADDVHSVHTGYFSIDKKGHSVDSKCERGKDTSNDESAYDLIMKNKEALLSFDNPVRFIFSHSALREGWDNPNIFQICTLKTSNSDVNKRQEVGRGMRLCVNQQGERMDLLTCGEELVHKINQLTVVASESYAEFVGSLQDDMKAAMYKRPTQASIEYFADRMVKINDKQYKIDKAQANTIMLYLGVNGYADYDGKITEKYKDAVKNNNLAPLPPQIMAIEPAVHKLIQGIFDENVLKEMIADGKETKVKENPLNDNFHKDEFQALWNRINHKYAYKVNFSSEELIKKAVAAINNELEVTKIQYKLVVGSQKESLQEHELDDKTGFATSRTKTSTMDNTYESGLKYDLLHEIASRTTLTRRTVAKIIQSIENAKYRMFAENPLDFINKVSKIINVQKSALVVDHVTYNTTNETFDTDIFTAEYARESFAKAFVAKHAIQNYVFTDGTAEKSVERKFVEELDTAEEVVVYAKLPRGFYIPTPVGKYSPDWAIAFKKGVVKHIYFVAETKGTLDSMELRAIENAKISCAKKLFAELSDGEVQYGQVKDYNSLMDIVLDKQTHIMQFPENHQCDRLAAESSETLKGK